MLLMHNSVSTKNENYLKKSSMRKDWVTKTKNQKKETILTKFNLCSVWNLWIDRLNTHNLCFISKRRKTVNLLFQSTASRTVLVERIFSARSKFAGGKNTLKKKKKRRQFGRSLLEFYSSTHQSKTCSKVSFSLLHSNLTNVEQKKQIIFCTKHF